MKKFTIFFTLLVAMATTAIADNIQVSTSTANPEHRYTMQNDADEVCFANSNTAPTRTEANYGHFAFFAVEGVSDAYYVYSVNAGKFLSYDKADSYEIGMDKIKLVDTQDNYFYITKCSNYTRYYELRPYKNNGDHANLRLNWYGGINSTYYQLDNGSLGLWSDDGNTDKGSRFLFTEIKVNVDIYLPNYTGERNGNYANRYITNIALNEDNLAINDTEKTQFYVDKTADKTFTVKVGDPIKINLTTDATWMHSYIYIDKDNNGFTAQLDSDGYTPIGDLVAYSYYNNRNSLGALSNGLNNSNTLNEIPQFNAPTTPGTYRMRYKMDWDDIAPNGNSGFQSNSGFMVDFLLKVQSIASRTITVTTETADCVVKANNTIGGVTAENKIELTAEAAFGYRFIEWQLDGESVSTNATYIDETEGDKRYVAVFERMTAEEQYEAISKPIVTSVNNPSFVMSATISDGKGIGNTNENIVPENQINKNQNGASAIIPVANGATFNLNVSFAKNWGDLSIIKIVNGIPERIYDRIEGSWSDNGSGATADELLQYIKNNLGIPVSNEGIVSLPIAIDENQKDGDLVVIRFVFANDYELTTTTIDDATFFDVRFVIGGYDLNVSSAGYATMFLNCNAIIPEDVEAYIATSNSNTMIFMEQITGILPANTGVIIKADPNTYRFQYTADDVASINNNMLKGTVAATYINEDAYVLSNQGGMEIGFYKAKKNKDMNGNSGNTHFLNNAYKAYLPSSALTSTAQSSNGFKFNFDGTTAIEEVKGAE